MAVIAAALAARWQLSAAASTSMLWAMTLAGGVSGGGVAALLIPRVAARLRLLAHPASAVAVLLPPLAMAAAWAMAYVRWSGFPSPAWARAFIAVMGLAVGCALAVGVAGALRRLAGRAAWWRAAAAILPLPLLAGTFAWRAQTVRSRPPVILITIDALRPDRVGAYGSEAGLTPNLDAFAQEAVVFEQAFAASPWTAPSVASMFTGRYPHELGLTSAGAQPSPLSSAAPMRRVEKLPPLLAEILREGGYLTAAVIANPCLEWRLAWNRGFDYFRNAMSAPPEPTWREPHRSRALLGWRHLSLTGWFARRNYLRPHRKRVAPRGAFAQDDAEDITRASLSWLERRDPRRPPFLWVHYIDPHEPYGSPQAPADALAMIEALDPPLRSSGLWMDMGMPEPEVPEPVRAAMRALYDDEVRYTDAWVGRLLDYLRGSDLYQRSLIIISADHGEELWDDGQWGHGMSLRDELLHVPLMIKFPAAPGYPAAPTRGSRQVRLLDLLPTVLEVTGTTYSGPFRGRSLLAALRPDDAERPLFAEGLLFGPERKGLRTERYKVIYRTDAGRFQVYDLHADPDEQRNLASDQKVAAEERRMLAAWMEAARPGAPAQAETQLTPEMREKLRSLGYLAQ